jgi:hypothetical protein
MRIQAQNVLAYLACGFAGSLFAHNGTELLSRLVETAQDRKGESPAPRRLVPQGAGKTLPSIELKAIGDDQFGGLPV